MIYKIKFKKQAQKFIDKQPQNQQKRLIEAIYNLPNGDVKKLQGNYNNYRLRVRRL